MLNQKNKTMSTIMESSTRKEVQHKDLIKGNWYCDSLSTLKKGVVFLKFWGMKDQGNGNYTLLFSDVTDKKVYLRTVFDNGFHLYGFYNPNNFYEPVGTELFDKYGIKENRSFADVLLDNEESIEALTQLGFKKPFNSYNPSQKFDHDYELKYMGWDGETELKYTVKLPQPGSDNIADISLFTTVKVKQINEKITVEEPLNIHKISTLKQYFKIVSRGTPEVDRETGEDLPYESIIH